MDVQLSARGSTYHEVLVRKAHTDLMRIDGILCQEH